ncbi:MAG: carboxypeptidase regulatory-like domain-containing protein [Verrucomicrobiia bacterium]|jgi:hypothetical protein
MKGTRTCLWWCAALVVGVAPFSLSGFVLDIQSPDPALRWHLEIPDAGVSTNTVNPNTKAVRYFLGADGFSPGNVENELNAIRASFDQWEAVSGTHLKFEEGGLMGAGVDLNASDNTNVVFFAKSTLVGGGTVSIAGTLGITCIGSSGGVIEEADIVLNGAQWNWFTDHTLTTTGNNDYFIEGTTTHEIGHLIGLLHSPVGGATMLAHARAGLKDHQIGLSSDELAAARFLYPVPAQIAQLGVVQGRVTKNAAAVFGAIVVAENASGNIVSGTVTDSNGDYQLPALEPGAYLVRATPLDPAGSQEFLARGIDIGSEFAGAHTDFASSANQAVNVSAGQMSPINLAVSGPNVGYHISHTRSQDDAPLAFPAPVRLALGAENVVVGVLIPSQGAVVAGTDFQITGNGLTIGATTIDTATFAGFTLVETTVSVAANATPGLRSIRISQGPEAVHANGFAEILPAVTDHNFDGLDDSFQRANFSRWTASEAAPSSDPDNDHFPNASEAAAGTDPNDSNSRWKIQSVAQDMTGTTVTFQSAAGLRYQLTGRDEFSSGAWANVGGPVTASDATTQILDAGATGAMKFYRVESAP